MLNSLQISKYYPPVVGGIESTVEIIANGLNSHGWLVEVLCANNTRQTVVSRGKILIVRAASILKLASTPICLGMICHLKAMASRANVIHVHLPNPMANLAIFFVRPRANLIVHWHSDIVKQKFLLKLYAPLQSWLLNRANLIICTSPPYAKTSKWLSNYQAKVRILPLSIPDPLLSQDFDELKISSAAIRSKYMGKKVIFSLGRMTYYKGFETLIEAATELPDDVVVLIGGEGELFEKYKKICINLNLSGKVIFLGGIPQAHLSHYYQAADIFCLPSLVRSEAFGLVLVEAMSFALPIVATDIAGSGVPWVNQNNVTGLNVEPGNSAKLASALNMLLNDPILAKKFGEAGRERFENYFELGVMVEALKKIYGELQAKKKSYESKRN